MELKTIINTPAVLEFNYDEILKNLTEYSEKYIGLVVTEENLKEMTGVKTELSKVETFIEDFRKAQKKKWKLLLKLLNLNVKHFWKL